MKKSTFFITITALLSLFVINTSAQASSYISGVTKALDTKQSNTKLVDYRSVHQGYARKGIHRKGSHKRSLHKRKFQRHHGDFRHNRFHKNDKSHSLHDDPVSRFFLNQTLHDD